MADTVEFTRDGRNLSILEVVKGLADQVAGPELTVLYYPPEDPPADVFPAEYHAITKAKGSTEDRGHKRQSESVWDIIQELALSAGLIATVVLDQIRIMKPSTVYSNVTDNVTRFYFTLGRDVEEYRVRKLNSRRSGIHVVCTSLNPRTGEILEARWSDEEKPKKAVIHGVRIGDDSSRKVSEHSDRDFRPFVFRGIDSQTQLDEIAKQIGHQLMNREVEAQMRTAQMVDRHGRSVVGLRYGSAVQVDYADGVEMFVNQNPSVQTATLVLQGQESYDVAKLVDALQGMKLPFYVHRVRHQFTEGQGNGYRLEVELRARHQVVTDKSLPTYPQTRGVVDIQLEAAP